MPQQRPRQPSLEMNVKTNEIEAIAHNKSLHIPIEWKMVKPDDGAVAAPFMMSPTSPTTFDNTAFNSVRALPQLST